MTNILQDAIGNCCEARFCSDVCPLLKNSAPADLAQAVLSENVPQGVIDSVSTCSLCGLCNEACPSGVNIRNLIKRARGCLVEKGAVNPEWYRHLWVDHDWNVFTLFRKEYGLDNVYQDLIKDHCTTLFMPGCVLAMEGPRLVRLVANWLSRQGEDTGVSVQCCGAILDQMGTEERAERYSSQLWDQIRRTGARQVVTACPNCQARMLETKQASEVTVVSLFQLMAEAGVEVPASGARRVTVHDSCSDREGRIGAHVRALLKNQQLVEMPHHGRNTICCGSGGVVSAIAPELCRERAEQRLQEVRDTKADTCVTYCMSCAHRLGAGTGANIRHILELVFQETVDHQEFDSKAVALFEGERGQENYDLLQHSKLSV